MINHDNHEHTETRKQRYVIIDGHKVVLTPEQLKAWDKFVNDERNRARAEKSCGQPDYHLCCGDCAVCPYRVQGRTLSTDHEDYGDGYVTGPNRAMQQSPSAEAVYEQHETVRAIYTKAAQLVKNGDRILYLKTVDNLSSYEIARELDMSQTTVNKYVNRLLAYLREHREDFL